LALAISTLLEAIISPLDRQKIVRKEKTRLQTWQLLAKIKHLQKKVDGRRVCMGTKYRGGTFGPV
jgi:hypothetical protein